MNIYLEVNLENGKSNWSEEAVEYFGFPDCEVSNTQAIMKELTHPDDKEHLQQELADAKEANTTRYNVIMNSMNLEEIREIAIGDFGMVYAEADQIIKYHRPDGSAVTQFAGIPESGIIASSDDVK